MFRGDFRSRCFVLALTIASLGLGPAVLAQDNSSNSSAEPNASSSTQGQGDQEADPLKRPLSDKQKKANAKSLKQELSKTYKRWLNEDVAYIITPEERAAFKQLSNDEERDNFIEAFWQRRDPTPDTPENEFKEEHYRRIAYANEHYAAGMPGWKTDRGRMYIMWGPPDEIESHPSGGMYERPMDEGGGQTTTYPWETWRYRYLEGVGQEVIMEFVDTCMCGEYHYTMDPGEKDAMAHVPGAGMSDLESMGLAQRTDRGTASGLYSGPSGFDRAATQNKEFDVLEQYAKLNAPPPIKFKDLEEEAVSHKIIYNMMPFDVRADYVKVTSDTVLVPLTIQVKDRDVTFVNKEGVQRGTVNVFIRISTISGKVAYTHEDVVQADIPAELLPKMAENSQVYSNAFPLRPGRYKVDVVLKDVNGDREGRWTKSIVVPDFADDRLDASSLIVAGTMEPVPTRNVGSGMFVIGTTKVVPRVGSADGKPPVFKRTQKVNFWMQVYNLGTDEKTHKPSATFEYDVVDAANNKAIIHTVESTDSMKNAGDQVTLEKALSAANLNPGVYRIQIKVNDKISKQTVDPTATFAVE